MDCMSHKISRKKFIALCGGLVSTLILPKKSFALDNEGIYFEYDLPNQDGRIVVRELNEVRTVEVFDVQNKLVNRFIYYIDENLMYSSITGHTTSLVIQTEPEQKSNDGYLSFRAVTKRSVVYISYSQIKNNISGAIDVLNVTGAMMACIKGLSQPGAILQCVQTVVSILLKNYNPPQGGVKLTLETTEYYRTRAGHRHVWRRQVIPVGYSFY